MMGVVQEVGEWGPMLLQWMDLQRATGFHHDLLRLLGGGSVLKLLNPWTNINCHGHQLQLLFDL